MAFEKSILYYAKYIQVVMH